MLGFRFDSDFHTVAAVFTPLSRRTVRKSHCGIGGLDGCMMSSHRNKCHDVVCVSVNESIVSFYLGGIVLRKCSTTPTPSQFSVFLSVMAFAQLMFGITCLLIPFIHLHTSNELLMSRCLHFKDTHLKLQ